LRAENRTAADLREVSENIVQWINTMAKSANWL